MATTARLDRILFFGTPAFAVPVLEALVNAGRRPLLAVTQPSRPAGRGRRVVPPPVAEAAARHRIEVAQPAKVRDAAFLERVEALAPSVAVVVAFGQIFPAALLALPAAGCINVHASLLPAYRGASPIQAAVAAGDAETGITTMLMEEGLDSGPTLLRESLSIGANETAGALSERLAALGGRLLVETLDRLEAGDLEPRPQNHAAATTAPRIRKQDGRVDWTRPAEEIFCLLRAFTPWPGLTAGLGGQPVKVVWGEPLESGSLPDEAAAHAAPGTYFGLRRGSLAVACGGGTVFGIERLQRPGRKPLAAADFANGERLQAGTLLT